MIVDHRLVSTLLFFAFFRVFICALCGKSQSAADLSTKGNIVVLAYAAGYLSVLATRLRVIRSLLQ